MSLIVWNPAWVTGVPAIDRQHWELVAEIERLHTALQAGREEAAAERILLHLSDYVDYHFATEERLMDQAEYPGLEAHKAAHEHLRAEVKGLIAIHLRDSVAFTQGITAYLSNWLINHLDTVDRDMAAHLRRRLILGSGA